jgi:FAD/FMN-containing dehydrogenase
VGPADTLDDRIRRVYHPEVYDKLQTVKQHYDPDNRFRLNHNIPPRSVA